MKKTIWTTKQNSQTTNKNIETDILIIGGGITGITLSLYLKDKNVTLIDANKIGTGITEKSTAKISIMQEYNYQKIKNILSETKSLEYLDSQIYAKNELINIIKKYKIDCDLEKNESYLFTNDKKMISKIKVEKNILEKRIRIEEINKLPNNYPCIYGIKTNESYIFNPIKYINEVKKICQNYINIYENIRALDITKKIDYYLVKTNKNKIKAKKIIICTHYPFIKNLHLPFKTTIEKEYILSAKCKKTYKANMISNDNDIISIRYYKDNIIYASNKSKLQTNLNHKENMTNLIINFKKHFNEKIEYNWYNYDITSNDYIPITGKIKNTNIIVATAFNKWGITNGILSANIIKDIINNEHNNYEKLLSPYRKTNIKKIINNIKYSLTNIKGYFNKKQKNIKYKVENGIEYAIYIDESKKEHKIINQCPHMKCKLQFNELDKTWDCPCHSSRFTIDGIRIIGPSTKSIKPKK